MKNNSSLKKVKLKVDESAADRILKAASHLFTEKGFSAITTRDIANQAGTNSALVNYYFRSKEKLFELIMKENFSRFVEGISGILNDEQTTIWQKIDLLVEKYIELLTVYPDMPLFVLTQSKQEPHRMKMREKVMNSIFMKQVHEAIKSGEIQPIDPVNMMLNIFGLTIFPFIGRVMFQNNQGMTKEQFSELMQERKRMIPRWLNSILKTPVN